MEPIVLEKIGGGEALVDPDNVVTVESYRNQTVVVTGDYQVYWVREDVESVRRLLKVAAGNIEEEE